MTEGDSQEPEAESDNEFAENVVQQIYEHFLNPETDRREVERDSFTRALVVLPPAPGELRVLLDNEFEMSATFRAARDIAYGEEVTSADISDLTDLHPVVPDPDAGWVAVAKLPDGRRMVAFDFRRNLGRAAKVLKRFDQYRSAADAAVELELKAPAIDLAHAACELLIECLMGRFDETANAGRGSHRRRDHWIARESEMGNVPKEFQQLYARLAAIRGSARYAERSEQYDRADVAALVAKLGEFGEYAAQQVTPRV
ncbi:hypothetical protein [Pseudonocardia endophytica]|uniref:Uncharacterized protein n=1 Tax=Pseudonocardia endophytica TaxID=401976 RepID=A0A4R1HGU6_PSEEN|nr:hypothetical protein [Pseudonocardia endophytica]TCK21397.1 hypothetical protein EV378_5381 [Pseudonocardia endophytica]